VTSGTLAADARAELAALVPERRCDRLAEISALFHTAGAVHLLGRGVVSFHLDLAESAVARRAYSILKELRVVSEIRTYHRRSFDRAARTQLLVAGAPHAIESYLAVSGASDTVLGLEERALVAELRAEANRLANADHANLVRQSRAARAQLEAVQLLDEEGVLDGLGPALQAAAELRRRHPSLSSRELAARTEPPITKAAMAARLARLVSLAREPSTGDPRTG
jgi:DNA-binding transcriptional regulator WhiA